ncbi:MAG: c-type cytochrome [Candidatus Binatia bacterium]
MGNCLLIAFVLVAALVCAPFNAAGGPLDSAGAQKALVCSACHGFAGNSPGNTVPIIAGMAPNYFKKAIKDYAEGKRPSPEMEPYSKYVLQAGIDEIADYFAIQTRQRATTKSDPSAVKRGAALAGQCVACHGPSGEGDAFQAIPAIQGQPAGYLQLQLTILKENKRKLDDAVVDETKKTMLKPLSEADLAGLAAYFSSLK